MKASEILRDLAQLLDTIDGKEKTDQAPEPVRPPTLIVPVKGEEGERANPDDTMFVPPLQAKIELLKKSVGVPNHYEEIGEPDELSMLKKAAGLTAVRQIASDDEPLDN